MRVAPLLKSAPSKFKHDSNALKRKLTTTKLTIDTE